MDDPTTKTTLNWTVAVVVFTEMDFSPQSFAVVKLKLKSSEPESSHQYKHVLDKVPDILLKDILPRLVIASSNCAHTCM